MTNLKTIFNVEFVKTTSQYFRWPFGFSAKIGMVLLFLFATLFSHSQQVAFPGAQGGGSYASGGRGGMVVFVTSLADDHSPGTLRHAVNISGKRIIVFKVSGTIFLRSPLSIRNGDVTIAGQSAPGDGICIAHYPVTVDGDNIIIRYLRFRLGYIDGHNADGADAFSGRQTNNVIIDHCSVSWSTDECSSFYDNENFTMQWCIIAESLRLSGHSKGPHGYGAIWGGVNSSYHHNLLAHHDSRTPRFGPGEKYAGKDRTDVRNNVFYNWNGNGCYGGEAMAINLVNNYYQPGPATSSKVSARIISISAKDGNNGFAVIKGVWGKYYISGNFFPLNTKVTASNWEGVKIEGGNRSQIELMAPIVTTMIAAFDAHQAYKQVLAYAGCSLRRDEIDQRIVDETKSRTASFIGRSPRNGEGKSLDYPKLGIIDSQWDLKPAHAAADWSPWPALKSSTPAIDTDGDGMPDVWEKKKGLNHLLADANGRSLGSGYDHLEIYLNEIVSTITAQQYQK